MTAKPRKVVLFGNGQMASFAHTVLTHDSPHEVVAFTVDGAYITENTLLGLPVVPFEDIERSHPPDAYAMHISVSFRRVNQLRASKYQAAKEKGYELVSYVSSRAHTWPGLTIGDNCWILEHSIIHPFVTIGNDVYMGSAVHVGHNSTIGDHSFLVGMIAIAGFVKIGTCCFIGIHSTLRDGLTIADRTVIGAGSTIMRDTQQGSVYVAPPARALPYTSENLADDFR
jgi:sugar O-acyltransferase (sialic acid O-acetyltransferase NeuD family)